MGPNLANDERKEPSLQSAEFNFGLDDSPLNASEGYDVVELKMEEFEEIALQNVRESTLALRFATNRIRALEESLEAEKALTKINAAKMDVLDSRISALEGVLSFRNGNVTQAETLFDRSSKSMENAKEKLEIFADNIKKSPFIESVLLKIETAKAQTNQKIKTGQEVTTAFIEDVKRVASFMGKMVAAIKGIPAKVISTAKEKAISIADASAQVIRFSINEAKGMRDRTVAAASTQISHAMQAGDAFVAKTVNVGKATGMTTSSFVSGLARKAIAGIESITADFSANLSELEKADRANQYLTSQADLKQFENDLYNNPNRALDVILQNKINPNEKIGGIPILSLSLSKNNIELARTLLNKGADANLYADNPAAERGMAPIHFAKSVHAIELLASVKAAINAPYKHVDHAWGMRGETALHTFALSDSENALEMADALLRAGADASIPFGKEYDYGDSNLAMKDRIIRGSDTVSKVLSDKELDALLTTGPRG